MPCFTARQIETCFNNKLRASPTEGGRHKRYEFFDDDGRLVASTVTSRGWKGSDSLSDKMVGKFREDLHLQGRSQEFTLLIRCPLTRAAWLLAIDGRVNS